MSNDQPTTSPADSATPRTDRIAALLDKAIDNAAAALEDGTISSSLLKEIVALAKSAGIEIGKDGQSLTTAFDPILESMKDLDPALFEVPDYAVKN